MISKLYEKIINFMKKYLYYILCFVFVLICLVIPLPYYISAGGGTINISDRISVSNGYESKGKFQLAYVKQLQATIPTYLLSYVIPDWQVDSAIYYIVDEHETSKDVQARDHLYLDSANSTAISVAYKLAGAEFKITDIYNNVMFISPDADTNLKIGDIIVGIDGKKIKSVDEYKEYVENSSIGTKINLNIIRDKKEKDAYIYVKKIDGAKLTGISVLTTYDYETNPDIKVLYKEKESGSSGGFTTALAIYDRITKEDLTHGLNIVGTGTIDESGKVESIGGVTYKLKGAVKNKADIFFVPRGENYDDAVAYAKKKKYKIKIVPVATIEDAIDYLEEIK